MKIAKGGSSNAPKITLRLSNLMSGFKGCQI